MTCDTCMRPFNYCFYINDEHWHEAVGKKKEGYLCAHCILEQLGGLDWYIIWNEPQDKADLILLDAQRQAGVQKVTDYDDLLERRASLVEQAIEACPWQNTDHLGERRYNYCAWCEGYVSGLLSLETE